MGSDYNTAGAQTPGQVTNSWMSLLPQISQLLGAQGGGVANSALSTLGNLFNPADVNQALSTAKGNASSAATAVKNAQLAYKQHPTPENKAALQAAQQQFKFSNSAVTSATANAAGGQPIGLNQLNAQNAQAFGNTINPNYTRAQEAASRGAASAVNAINLNGLSPGEAASVERSLNQTNTATGNAGLVNPTNVISNAMNFGGAFNSKIPLMTQAAQGASNAANSATSMGGFTPIQAQPLQAQAQQNVFSAGPQTFGSMMSGNAAAQGAGATMAGQTSPATYLNSTLGNL
jgi:hypothetical protein